MSTFLSTERMLFQIFQSQDSLLIKGLDSDPEVMKYISNGIVSDDKEVQRAMNIFLNFNEKYEGRLGFWKAIDKKTNSFMGWFHLRPLKKNLDDLENLELGYRLKKKFWKQGFATEGSRALLSKAKSYHAKKIWAHAMQSNQKSIRVMEKLGLTHDFDDIYEAWPTDDNRCVWYSLSL